MTIYFDRTYSKYQDETKLISFTVIITVSPSSGSGVQWIRLVTILLRITSFVIDKSWEACLRQVWLPISWSASVGEWDVKDVW